MAHVVARLSGEACVTSATAADVDFLIPSIDGFHQDMGLYKPSGSESGNNNGTPQHDDHSTGQPQQQDNRASAPATPKCVTGANNTNNSNAPSSI